MNCMLQVSLASRPEIVCRKPVFGLNTDRPPTPIYSSCFSLDVRERLSHGHIRIRLQNAGHAEGSNCRLCSR
jgi:hypothetical protein